MNKFASLRLKKLPQVGWGSHRVGILVKHKKMTRPGKSNIEKHIPPLLGTLSPVLPKIFQH